MCRRGLIIASVSLVLVSQSAEANWWWYLLSWFDPREYRCFGTQINDDDDIESHTPLLESDCNANSYTLPTASDFNHAQQQRAALAYLQNLPEELQQEFKRQQITPEQIARLIPLESLNQQDPDEDPAAQVRKIINELMLLFAHTPLPEELHHHTLIRLGVLLNNITLGAVNRITGFVMINTLLLGLGVAPDTATVTAAVLTVASLLSSNLRATAGASGLSYRGYNSVRDVLLFMVAMPVTFIDILMEIFGFKKLMEHYGITGIRTYIPGAVFALPMGVGLTPLLMQSADQIGYDIRGQSYSHEQLVQGSVHLLKELLRIMTEQQLTMAPEHLQTSLEAFSEALQLDTPLCSQNPKELIRTALSIAAIHAPECQLRNECADLLNSGLLNEEQTLSFPELLHQQAIEQRHGKAYVACNAGIVAASLTFAVFYGFVDATDAYELLQTLILGGQMECINNLETISYWITSIGLTLLMSTKFLAACQSGAHSTMNFIQWVYVLIRERRSTASRTDIGLNAFSAALSTTYALNAGVTIGVDSSPCLTRSGITTTAGVLAGAGAYGFTAGSGHKLKALKPATQALYESLKHSYTKRFGSNGKKLALKVISDLRRGVEILPASANFQNWLELLGIHDSEGQSIIYQWLKMLPGYQNIELRESESEPFTMLQMEELPRAVAQVTDESEPVLEHEEQAVSTGRNDQRAYTQLLVHDSYIDELTSANIAALQHLQNFISQHGFTTVNLPCPESLCMFQQALFLTGQSANTTPRELVNKLIAFLKRLMHSGASNGQEHSFLFGLSETQLQQLLHDLETHKFQGIETLQLIALYFNLDFIALQPDENQLTATLIYANSPGAANSINLNEVASNPQALIVAHNGINHWLGVMPGTSPNQQLIQSIQLHSNNGTEFEPALLMPLGLELNPATTHHLMQSMGLRQ